MKTVSAILLAALLAGAAQAQSLETTINLGIGNYPGVLAYDSVNNKVYCANWGFQGSVTVIDGASKQIVATLPVGCAPQALCCNPHDGKVYCANSWGDSVTVIDGTSNQVVTTIGVGGGPSALCYDPQDNKV